jgi:hypothetical protein
VDGVAITPTQVCSGSSYTITPSTALVDGSYALTSTSTDPAGNTTAQGPALNFVVDTTAPSLPTAPDMVTSSDSGNSNSDNLTNNTTPTFSGSCTDPNTVTLYIDGNVVSPTAVCVGGVYTITPSSPLLNGSHSITTRETDLAGNVTSPSTTLIINIDNVASNSPSITTVSTNPLTATNPTNDTTPTITGSGVAGDLVTIYDNTNNIIGTGLVNPSGLWSITSITPLPSGTNNFTVTQTDPAGNESTPIPLVITIDTIAPIAPVVNTVTGNPVNSTNPTNDTTPSISGNGEPNATVIIRDSVGNTIATAIVNGSGIWNATPISPLPVGANTLSITQTDLAGNISPSAPLVVTIDLTPSLSPIVTTVTGRAENGVNPTNDTTPTIAGTGIAGDIINIYDSSNNLIGTALVDSSGNWTITPTTALPAGVNNFTATQTDPASNISNPLPLVITIDLTAPTSPTCSATPNPSNGTVLVVISCLGVEPGATLIIPNTICSPNPASATGTVICVEISPGIVPSNPVATVTDVAGNSSSSNLPYTLDITAPTAPTITTPANNSGTINPTPTLGGNGEPNATLVIKDENGLIICTTVVLASGSWTCPILVPQPEGLHSFTAIQTDVAGNSSVPSALHTLNFLTDTDSASTPVENAAPNGGDMNGDGIPDADQNTVASKPNTANLGLYSSLETGAGCGDISNFDFTPELPLPVQDVMYDYPVGLFKFTVKCATPGQSITITFLLDKVYNTSGWVYRKYNTNTDTYTTIPATFGTRLIGTTLVTTMTFTAIEGGPLDEDGLTNGVFTDPSGPSVIPGGGGSVTIKEANISAISAAPSSIEPTITLPKSGGIEPVIITQDPIQTIVNKAVNLLLPRTGGQEITYSIATIALIISVLLVILSFQKKKD